MAKYRAGACAVAGHRMPRHASSWCERRRLAVSVRALSLTPLGRSGSLVRDDDRELVSPTERRRGRTHWAASGIELCEAGSLARRLAIRAAARALRWSAHGGEAR